MAWTAPQTRSSGRQVVKKLCHRTNPSGVFLRTVVERLRKPIEHFVDLFLGYDQRRRKRASIACRQRSAYKVIAFLGTSLYQRTEGNDGTEQPLVIFISYNVHRAHEADNSNVADQRVRAKGVEPARKAL